MRINSLLQAGVTNRQRKRSKQSYPTNLSGNIPGTNIGRGEGLSGWKNLARQGRRGDSALRDVGGQPSHVSKKEAEIIDSLGPLGEAWVESIGSGTRNPKTGLKEYYIDTGDVSDWVDTPGWMDEALEQDSQKDAFHSLVNAGTTSDNQFISGASKAVNWLAGEDSWINSTGFNTTWRPSQGDWGIFGSTWKSRKRKKEAAERARKKAEFSDYMAANKETDYANIFTQQGGLEGIWEKELEDNKFGLTKDDFKKYVNPYDTRAEDETRDSTEKVLETAGTKVDTGLFGLLTKSNELDTSQDLIDTGDFQADLAEQNLLKTAHTQAEDTIAKAESTIQDSRDDYNKEFWTGMSNYNKAVNA